MKKFVGFLVIVGLGYLGYVYLDEISAFASKFMAGNGEPLTYEMTAYENSYGECDKEDTPCLTLKLSQPHIQNLTGQAIVNDIEAKIDNLILNGGMDGGENTKKEDLFNNLVNGYKQMLADFNDYYIRWGMERKVEVKRNDGKYFTFTYDEYAFMGGAHPNYSTIHFNYDIELQKEVTLDDLFIEGYKKELTRVAEKKFRQHWEIGPNDKLSDFNFWFEDNKFVLNDNFLINKTNLEFFYNTYEIGPYAIGVTKIEIPFVEIRSLLKVQL